MNEIIIKKAEHSDAVMIAEIEKECFSVPWSQSSISEFIESDTSFVLSAFGGNEMIGYIGMYSTFDEADITNVAVLPMHRNKGVAKKLIGELIAHCTKSGIVKIRLEVRESNIAALSLYENFGFYKVGMRKNYYAHPKENAVLMDIDINTASEIKNENTSN